MTIYKLFHVVSFTHFKLFESENLDEVEEYMKNMIEEKGISSSELYITCDKDIDLSFYME